MSETPELICENLECDVSEKGKCVEGLELTKCPHFGKSPKAPEVSAEKQHTGEVLSSGAKLSIDRASQLLGASSSRVIAMIGPSEAGKTSLVASLYDLFQMGRVANHAFRRSLTLFEFEQTCHDARAASQRGEPHQPRTPRGEVEFYHLDLAKTPDDDGVTLLVADRGGEEYQDAMNDLSKVDEFVEVRRADTVCVLVDGARLLESGARHNLKAEVHQILSALHEGGALEARPKLALLLTKIDLFPGAGFRERAESDFLEIENGLREECGDCFSEVMSFKVAPSPASDAVPRGAGVPELLEYWLDEIEAEVSVSPASAPSDRMFGRFGQADGSAKP